MNRFIEAIADHPVRSALAAATAPAVALAINCGGSDGNSPTPDDLKSPTATVLETNTPMPSQTDMATQVTKSSTPLAEIPSFECGILDNQYCSEGKLIEWTDPAGVNYQFAAFSLPENIPIYAPFSGDLVFSPSGEGNPLEVPTVSLIDPTREIAGAFTAMGDLIFDNSSNRPVQEGEVIGHTSRTNNSVFDHTLAITFTGSNGTDLEFLEKHFPDFTK